MEGLTERQKQILEYIAQYTNDKGFPPTIREISEGFGISLRAVQDHVGACEKKGYLTQIKRCARSLRILAGADAQRVLFSDKVPVLDDLNPEAEDLLDGVNVSSSLVLSEPVIQSGKKYFAVTMKNAFLSNAGIFEADTLVFERNESAFEGQIVACIVDNCIVIGKFYRKDNQIMIQPDNLDFQPIYSQNARVVGTMAGLLRKC